MQFPGMAKPPVGVVFDSDIGNGPDSALALSLLYGFDGKNECRVISLSTSKPNLKSAGLTDAVARFYAGPNAFRTLAIGMADKGPVSGEDTPMLKPEYKHQIHKLNDTAEVSALIRNAFTSQYDGACMVILAGPATNLVKVLNLSGTKPWIVQKVKYLVVAEHIKADIAAAKTLYAEWPTPIISISPEVSKDVLFPAAAIEKDFAWSPDHPVVAAYKAYKPMPYDAPTHDMAAVLYGVRPKEGYFKVSEPGTITIADDGSTKFTPSEKGRHQQLIADPAQRERILKTYIELASAKPVPRTFRFRPPVVDDKDKKDEKKPSEAKPPAQEK